MFQMNSIDRIGPTGLRWTEPRIFRADPLSSVIKEHWQY